jgi:hypothetical protein
MFIFIFALQIKGDPESARQVLSQAIEKDMVSILMKKSKAILWIIL